MLALIAIIVLLSGAVHAWETIEGRVDDDFVERNGSSDFDEQMGYFKRNHNLTYLGNYELVGRMGVSHGFYYLDLGDLEPTVHVESLTVHAAAQVTEGKPLMDVFLVLGLHPEFIDPASLFGRLSTLESRPDVIYVGQISFEGSGEYTVSNESADISPWFERGPLDVWVVLRSTTADIYSLRVAAEEVYLSIECDASPPVVPALKGDTTGWLGKTTLELRWDEVADLPRAPNVGGVEYQVGVWRGVSTGEPASTLPWSASTDVTVTGLEDGAIYHFRVRARDAAGHVSEWSQPVSRTVDLTPPAPPPPMPPSPFTRGDAVRLAWPRSTDGDGVGNILYKVEWSTDATFAAGVQGLEWQDRTQADVSGLADGSTYHFRVTARDGLGNQASPSIVLTTTMDATAPRATAPDIESSSATVLLRGAVVETGSGVASVEVSWDGGQWEHAAFGGDSWVLVRADASEGTTGYRVRATDEAGNEGPVASGNVTVSLGAGGGGDGDGDDGGGGALPWVALVVAVVALVASLLPRGRPGTPAPMEPGPRVGTPSDIRPRAEGPTGLSPQPDPPGSEARAGTPFGSQPPGEGPAGLSPQPDPPGKAANGRPPLG